MSYGGNKNGITLSAFSPETISKLMGVQSGWFGMIMAGIIGAWSTTKIPMLLFEASSMGWKFMIARFVLDIPVILVIALITEKVLTPEEKNNLYEA